MGRPREYTPAKLKKAVEHYFQSITRTVHAMEQVDSGARDDKGHVIYERAEIVNNLGKPVEITEYIVPPCVADLCESLKIHRATWANYCKDEKYAAATTLAKDRMRAWNERELLTRPGKDVKGIIFNLQANYDYGGEKHEMELGPQAQKAVSGGTMAEKLALLRGMKDELEGVIEHAD